MAFSRGSGRAGSARTAALLAVFGNRDIVIPRLTGLRHFVVSDPELALLQGLRRRSASIDNSPIDGAKIVFFLKFCNFWRGVGCIAPAAADALHSGGEVGGEKEADEAGVEIPRGAVDRIAFGFAGKHRVDHDGMTLGKDPAGALAQHFVDLG